MKKLTLHLDTLAVDSFSIAADGAEAGTVHAQEAPTYPYYTCGCTTGASYAAAFCPPPSTATGCDDPQST
ncbi:MAG TPA: hypothetical protein VF771_21015 [Longimicrobiaceae bacterium]